MDELLKRRQESLLFSDLYAVLQQPLASGFTELHRFLPVQENCRSISGSSDTRHEIRTRTRTRGWRAHLPISGSGQKGVVNASSADHSMIYRNEAAISLDTVDLRR